MQGSGVNCLHAKPLVVFLRSLWVLLPHFIDVETEVIHRRPTQKSDKAGNWPQACQIPEFEFLTTKTEFKRKRHERPFSGKVAEQSKDRSWRGTRIEENSCSHGGGRYDKVDEKRATRCAHCATTRRSVKHPLLSGPITPLLVRPVSASASAFSHIP